MTTAKIINISDLNTLNTVLRKNMIPERDGEARETLADISHIKEKLSWVPSVMIKDWIKDNI